MNSYKTIYWKYVPKSVSKQNIFYYPYTFKMFIRVPPKRDAKRATLSIVGSCLF